MSRDTPLRERARGRWAGILPSLGIPPACLQNRHGPCPLCEGGTDRFRFDDKDGTGSWICSRCGAGDGIALVMARNGWDFRTAAERIEGLVGGVAAQASRPAIDDRRARDALNALWQSSYPVEPGDPVSLYLEGRIGAVSVPRDIRYCPDCWRSTDGGEGERLPAMVARLRDAEGKPTTLHRTYITTDGRKAPVMPAKMLMPGGRTKGDAIRLGPHQGLLGIAEGIETALSVTALTGIPCWSAVNDGGLANWIPPKGIESVVIYGDNDHSYAGQAAAYTLAKRLTGAGLTAQVCLPSEIGADWNDELIADSERGHYEQR